MKKIFVIFGGASAEHDISIITGMQLAKRMEENFKVEKFYFGLDNKFYLATKVQDTKFFYDKTKIKLKEVVFIDGYVYEKGMFLKKLFKVDVIVNCCHGGFGENGDLFSFFAVNKIKLTSADAISSHIAMDKTLAKTLLKDTVNLVKGLVVTKENFDEQVKIIDKEFPQNLIVKPNSLGSSIGVKACTKQDFKNQIMAIFEMNDDALVEQRIEDMCEYNQACYLTSEGLKLSAIEQPILKSNILSFDDKYNHNSKSKAKDRIIPAEISPELEEQIIETTAKIYTRLKLNGVVRIDYIFDNKTKTLFFNEVNTVPGSMAFYLYESVGIDYISLVLDLINNCKAEQKFSYFNSGILEKKLL